MCGGGGGNNCVFSLQFDKNSGMAILCCHWHNDKKLKLAFIAIYLLIF